MVVTYTKYCMARLHDGFERNLKSVHFHKLWSEGVEITSFKLSWLMFRYCLTRSFSSRVTDGVFSKIKKRNRIKRTLPELYRTSVVTKRYVRYSALGLDCYIQLSVFFRIWFLRSLAKFLLEVVFFSFYFPVIYHDILWKWQSTLQNKTVFWSRNSSGAPESAVFCYSKTLVRLISSKQRLSVQLINFSLLSSAFDIFLMC